MRLELSQNIKKYRKEMSLTQEELAETFGVTVGAVSKWESGSTVPDIMTMMELADFFNVSMDVLLGYNLSSKSIDDIYHRLCNLTTEQKLDEAVSEAEKALVRYPTCFKIIMACATLYNVLFINGGKEDDAKHAVELYERALKYFSQNDNLSVTEVSIRMDIARLKSFNDTDGALIEFNKINHMGIADIESARLLFSKGETEEALARCTKAMLYNLMREHDIALNMSSIVASRGTKKDFKEAYDILDRGIAYIESAENGNICYATKLKINLLIIKAMTLCLLKEHDSMKRLIDEAGALAKRYDADPNNAFHNGMKFWYAKEDFMPYGFDDLGSSAIETIELLFADTPELYPAKETKEYKEAKKYWHNEAKEYWHSIKEQ